MVRRISTASRCRRLARAAVIAGMAGAVSAMAGPGYAQTGCQAGASALGNAHVRANPIYALFIGDLESYVARNRSQFTAGSNAVRCARAMSRALMNGAIMSYDSEALKSQQALNAKLGSVGLSPGAPIPSVSALFYAMSQQMVWLARVLPSAASGNYGPLNTAPTEEQAFAKQMFPVLLQNPTVRDVFARMEPLYREAIDLEYRQVMAIAQGLGQ
jgi:hypothetical protein